MVNFIELRGAAAGLRSEEVDVLAELLLATTTTRRRWAASHVAVAAALSVAGFNGWRRSRDVPA